MKRILIATYLIGALAVAGSDFRIQTPKGRHTDTPTPTDPSECRRPCRRLHRRLRLRCLNTYYGYQHGDTTVIVNPGGGGSSFMYQDGR